MGGTTNVGGNAVMNIGSDTITLTGVTKASLSQTNFSGVHINGIPVDGTINGYASDDVINGLAGNDSINGSEGDDTIDSGAGNDDLRGGSGRDTMVFNTGFGADTLHGFTANFDSIDVTSLNIGSFSTLLSNTADVSDDAVITLSGNAITISNVTKSQLLEGGFIGLTAAASSGDDTPNGLGTADNIDGLGGNDTINGNAGDGRSSAATI